MKPRETLAELRRRDGLLAAVGWLHVGLFLVLLAIAPFDQRTVMGLNPWIKPMKFAASIALYLWTLAWYLAYLPGPAWALRLVRRGACTAMLVESACISMQAARGTTSHYNNATPFDGGVFGIMGLMIFFNTLLAALLLVLFLVRRVELSPAYLWGLRLGIALFVLGSVEGMVMIVRNAHTVGLPDGGPGLPLLNWSTKGGDLRVAHMLGLHALQAIPLAGWLIDRWREVPAGRRVAYVWAFAAAYGAAAGLLFWQALAGRPLLAL